MKHGLNVKTHDMIIFEKSKVQNEEDQLKEALGPKAGRRAVLQERKCTKDRFADLEIDYSKPL